MEFSLVAGAAIGVTAFRVLLGWEAKRGNASACALNLWYLGLVSATSGLIIGRITAMVGDGVNPLGAPGQIAALQNGVSTAAAAIGTLAVFSILARSAPMTAADAVAPSALFGLAGWRAGYLIAGTHLDSESSFPWAAPLLSGDVMHTVELYAAGALLVVGAALGVWKQRGRPPLASVTGAALLSVSTIRLTTELLQTSPSGEPVTLYAIGAISGVVIIVLAFHRRSRTESV